MIGATVLLALVLAACGGGDASPQDEVAELFVDAMADQGIVLDEDCTKDAAQELSDDDAQAMVDAGADAGADFSPAATQFAAKAASCIDIGSLVDQMVDLLGDDLVDGDCLKDALEGIDPAVIDSGDFPAEADACFADG
jgi:hypothetical protein